MSVPRIVLTGGPCAGKTTAIAAMSTWAREQGYLPIMVPEAATSLMMSGLDPRESAFQPAVLSHVLETEDRLEQYANTQIDQGQKPVLICDRGLWDQVAYMQPDSFRQLCVASGIHADKEKGCRYDGVLFLRTAAYGAEAFYSNESNVHRYESLAEAKELDQRTLEAWAGVSHLSVIENRLQQTFDEKIRRCVGEFSRILGIPEPMEIERKFDVRNFQVSQLPLHTVKSEIVQHYLMSERNLVERVRARNYHGQWVFTNTIKEFVRPGVAVERERIVTKAQYEDLLIRRDRTREVIHKFRFCFLYGVHHCELDVFIGGKRDGKVVLEIEVASLEDEVMLPPFLDIGDEQTNNPAASNYAMSAS